MRMNVVLISLASIVGLGLWFGHRSFGHARESFEEAVVRAKVMHSDAQEIEKLRAVPRLATERIRPNDELIAEIENAMKEASVPLKHWIANEPVPAVRVPRSPYQQIGVRLTFEDITLRQIVEFTLAMLQRDPTLRLERLRLAASPKGNDDAWNADVAIAYLVFAPQ